MHGIRGRGSGWRSGEDGRSGTFEMKGLQYRRRGISLCKVDVGRDVEENETGITCYERSKRSPSTSGDAKAPLDTFRFRGRCIKLMFVLETTFLEASGSPKLCGELPWFNVDRCFRWLGGYG
jgi:hypothetical protein